jgi:acetolactate synthase-1/2/3 large subunit
MTPWEMITNLAVDTRSAPGDAAAAAPGGRMSGGRALAEMLRLHGVGPMFGMGGFQLLPFYEAVRELGLRHYLINDERAGAFAADAYARVSGRPGVCDGTLGPGATNLVTGLVESLNAGVPVIAIIGDTNRAHSWKHMTQEARQIEILRPAVKEMLSVEQPERIPELVRRAFAIATSGRPGPVVLNIPENVAHASIEYAADAFYVDPATRTIPARRTRPDSSDLDRAVALLRRARRPLVLAGGGVHLSGAAAALTAFAGANALPVAHTLSGKGAIPCTHELSVGLFGRYSRYANELIAQADCLLVIGCKLGEIATKRYELPPAGIPLIHVDIVPEEFGRTTAFALGLWGDARATIEDLGGELGPAETVERRTYLTEIGELRARWYAQARERYESAERPIHMARIMHELNGAMPPDGILVADGGFAAHWAGLFYDTKCCGRTFVADRGFASIGYGLPGSLGAQLAAPGVPVVGLTGDGGFNMMLGELETARRIGLPLTVIVVNNAASGYVKALQHAMFGGKYQSSDLVEINYAGVAEALGCRGVRIDDPADLGAVLRDALRPNGRTTPLVIDVVVTRDPARMLPAADNRTLTVAPGDRPV